MIERNFYKKQIIDYLEVFKIVGILGPRQCGKTTLALQIANDQKIKFHRFDLEDPEDFEILKNPKTAFKNLKGLIIIDEIQRNPELFPYLRTYSDNNNDVKILILGSCSPDLIRFGSESLAGRIGFVELSPFLPPEIPFDDKILYRGGFPKSYLSPKQKFSKLWIKEYVSTFLEKDIAAMGFNLTPESMRKVWMMVAHYHGNIVNFSEIGRSLGVTDKTVKRYIDILSSSFMVRELPSWHENLKKRQVKNPKIYVRDTGILHYLLGIDENQSKFHPKIGSIFEGFAIETIINIHKFEHPYFWRTQDGAELDLFVIDSGKRIGFEFKLSDAVKFTPSMRNALNDLKLDHLFVITNGEKQYSLNEKTDVIPLSEYIKRHS